MVWRITRALWRGLYFGPLHRHRHHHHHPASGNLGRTSYCREHERTLGHGGCNNYWLVWLAEWWHHVQRLESWRVLLYVRMVWKHK